MIKGIRDTQKELEHTAPKTEEVIVIEPASEPTEIAGNKPKKKNYFDK